MKITLIIPTLKQGGSERVMSLLANIWVNQGHDVHLFLQKKDDDVFYKISKKIKLHYFEESDKPKFKLFYILKLRRFLKKENPDFALSFLFTYNILLICSSIFLKTKIYISDRNNLKEKIPKVYEFLRKHLYKYATGIIAQTNMAKEIIEAKTHSENIEVIPNPLHEFTFDKTIKKENIILNVGRLVEEKGQKYLIDSFSKIKNKTNWKLVILGDGELRAPLEQQIKNLELTEKVILQGSVKNVEEWLSKSSIFAFSSVSEGFPNALVEAMAFGLPCVTFDCDAGPRDIIEDGKNGFLVEFKNVEEFSKKIELLIENVELREKFAYQAQKVQQEYNSKAIAKRVLDYCSQN